MKFKAVMDLYKELKTIGLTSYYKTTASLFGDNSIVYDFKSLNADREIHSQDPSISEVVSYLLDAENYYYKLLDQINLLKTRNDFV